MILQFGVEFGSPVIGDKWVRLPVQVKLDELSPEHADAYFRHKRITAELQSVDTLLRVTCDVSSVSANKDGRRFTLKADISDRDDVVDIGNWPGTLMLLSSDTIEETKKQTGRKRRVLTKSEPTENTRSVVE